MSSTRYAPTDSDPSNAPERNLQKSKLRGLQIGLNIVCRVARVRPEEERRAMIWLANYATVMQVTADALSEEIDLEKGYIRSCLTDPDEDLKNFVRCVKRFRTSFEASIPQMVNTKVNQEVSTAFRYAAHKISMVEVVGKNRMGKSDCARTHWLKNLDRCVWFECPSANDDRTFTFDLGRALGIAVNSGKKAVQVKPQIKACFGPNLINLLIVDEAHRLWPADLRCKPLRIEFEREIYNDGRGCSVMNLATPQHTISLNLAMEGNGRWAPGQYQGRVVPFPLSDTMSDADLSAVAKHYAPELKEDAVRILVLQAKATEGYCGLMVNTINLARFYADGGKIEKDQILKCIDQVLKGTNVARLADAHKASEKLVRRTS